MIIVRSISEAVSTYVYEGLRRTWAVSVNENGEFVNFDLDYNTCKVTHGMHMMNFANVYCTRSAYDEIIEQLVKEPYRMKNGKIHYLKKKERDHVRINVSLGPSPVYRD